MLGALLCAVGQQGTNLGGFGGADGGVAGEGLLPVMASLTGVAGGLIYAGEAAVCSGLLPCRAGLGDELERGGVVNACLVRSTHLEVNLAEAVERVCLHDRITDLAEDDQGPLEIPGGVPVAAKTPLDVTEPDQALGLACRVTHVAKRGYCLPEVPASMLVTAEPKVNSAEPGQRQRFAFPIAYLAAQVQGLQVIAARLLVPAL